MNLKIFPLRAAQIISRKRNSRNTSFRNVIWLLIMYLLGIADDPKSNASGLDYRVRMEPEIFARENLFLNE